MLYRKVGSNVRLLNYITHDANGEDATGSVGTDNRIGRGCRQELSGFMYSMNLSVRVCVCMEMTCVSLCNRVAINQLQVCHTRMGSRTQFLLAVQSLRAGGITLAVFQAVLLLHLASKTTCACG